MHQSWTYGRRSCGGLVVLVVVGCSPITKTSGKGQDRLRASKCKSTWSILNSMHFFVLVSASKGRSSQRAPPQAQQCGVCAPPRPGDLFDCGLWLCSSCERHKRQVASPQPPHGPCPRARHGTWVHTAQMHMRVRCLHAYCILYGHRAPKHSTYLRTGNFLPHPTVQVAAER